MGLKTFWGFCDAKSPLYDYYVLSDHSTPESTCLNYFSWELYIHSFNNGFYVTAFHNFKFYSLHYHDLLCLLKCKWNWKPFFKLPNPYSGKCMSKKKVQIKWCISLADLAIFLLHDIPEVCKFNHQIQFSRSCVILYLIFFSCTFTLCWFKLTARAEKETRSLFHNRLVYPVRLNQLESKWTFYLPLL